MSFNGPPPGQPLPPALTPQGFGCTRLRTPEGLNLVDIVLLCPPGYHVTQTFGNGQVEYRFRMGAEDGVNLGNAIVKESTGLTIAKELPKLNRSD